MRYYDVTITGFYICYCDNEETLYGQDSVLSKPRQWWQNMLIGTLTF